MTPLPVAADHNIFSLPAFGLGRKINLGGTLAGHGGRGPGYSAGALPRLSDPCWAVTALVNCDRDEVGLQLLGALLSVLEGGWPLK